MRKGDGFSVQFIWICRRKDIEKGIQKGREEGENALGKLMDILLSKGDVANAKLAATDEKARKELYRKYGIIEKP